MIGLSVRLPAGPALVGRRSIWRSRAALFGGLGLLVLANVAVLVIYHVFYDQRFQALSETKAGLTVRRDEARAGADRAAEMERKLVTLKSGLEGFYGETLGARKERLAALIEEVYAILQKSGFAPQTVAFAEDVVPGAERFAMTFQIDGRYADVRKLLYVLETSPKFLVLEQVRVTTDEIQPDVLRLALTISHYFRGETARVPKGPKRPAAKAAAARPEAPGPASPARTELE